MTDQWGRNLSKGEHAVGDSPCRQLMVDGKWLVPEEERPKLAPPPGEEAPSKYSMIRSLSWVGELNR